MVTVSRSLSAELCRSHDRTRRSGFVMETLSLVVVTLSGPEVCVCVVCVCGLCVWCVYLKVYEKYHLCGRNCVNCSRY